MAKTKQVMSQLKFIHWHEQVDSWKKGELVYPRLLQLDPVAGCNHSCPFCTYRAQSDDDANANFDESDMISYDDIVRILDDSKGMGIRAVELTGGGEPSLHPQFVEILSEIKRRGFKTGLITNGTGRSFQRRLGELVDVLKDAEWVRFSINGGETTHRLVHRGRKNDYEVVLTSVAAMCKAKSSHTKVGVSFILWDQNYRDIESSVATAQHLGCDYIRFAPALFGETTVLGKRYEEEPTYPIEVRRQIELALRHCKEQYSIPIIDVFSDRLNRVEAKERYDEGDFCYMSEAMAVVGADQHLYPCCIMKYTSSGDMGSIKDVGLKGLWESEERADYYKSMDISTMCVSCHFKLQNDGIAYALDTEPLHTDFI